MTNEAASQPLLEARNLTVWRGEQPLFDSISLALADGEILQIEGNNGAGKTTLLKVLCGLIVADEGDVLWRGRSSRSSDSLFHAETLYLGHKPGLKQELTATENLRSMAQLAVAEPASSLDKRIQAALERLQIADRADLPCRVLSAGQRRRVALARLLVSRARLWILDEPLTALDGEGRDRVQLMMKEHLQRQGAIIYTTHQPLPGFGSLSNSLKLTGSSAA